MKLKNVWLLTLIVCVLFLFLWQNLSFGYSKAWQTEENELGIKYKAVNGAETKLERYKSALGTLIGAWSANEKKIAGGTEVTLAGALGTSASALASALSKSTPITAVAGGLLTLRKAVEVGLAISASDGYVSAMSTADGAVSGAVTGVNTAYSEYTTQYSEYLKVCAAHNLVRFSNGTPSAVYSQSALDTAVNMSRQTRGWYHTTDSPSGTDHSIEPRWGTDHWNMDDAPQNYECKGTCTVTFRSPYSALMDHREKCGLPETQSIDDWAYAYGIGGHAWGTSIAIQNELDGRTVDHGCGRTWYNCDSDHLAKSANHQVRRCAKTYTNSNGVSSKCLENEESVTRFRRCMGHTRDHNESDWIPLKSEHSDIADSSPPTASTPPPPPQPTDNTPNCQDCTSDCSSPCNCTNSGTCGGTVSTPPSGSTPPSPSYHACNVHETSVSGDHSYISSCSSSNANGTCQNSSGYYACSPHSHSYPSPSSPPANPPSGSNPPSTTTVACGARSWTGCTVRSSDGNACRVDPCDSGCGSFYWSCSTSGVSWHKTERTCSRTDCNATYTDCSRGSDTKHCLGKYYYHQK